MCCCRRFTQPANNIRRKWSAFGGEVEDMVEVQADTVVSTRGRELRSWMNIAVAVSPLESLWNGLGRVFAHDAVVQSLSG